MQNIEAVSLETGASLWNYFFIVLKGKKNSCQVIILYPVKMSLNNES